VSQPFSAKRAQVEFHNFASLGQPERNLRIYAEENTRRRTVIRRHLSFIGEMTPFLEIGANAGHSSYMLANEFGAQGFALDLSADSLRHGRALMDAWHLDRAPIRLAGDAANLPFADESLRFVCAFQMLSQFMDPEAVFREVHRVLQPGGVFLFAEEPLRRRLSLRLYRCPYYNNMKPWERRLHDWGLLGYLVEDVIGAYQEESFGIRQNHTMVLAHWDALVTKYFAQHEYEVFVPERGWGERIVKAAAASELRAARWLGGTLAAVCKKSGASLAPRSLENVEAFLRCPDCHASLMRDASDTLLCSSCGYHAPFDDQVYNLLPAAERRELYPGQRDDIIDFSVPGHEKNLLGEWYELEGIHGNKYRWIGASASARLGRVKPGPQRLRIRGHASPPMIPGEIRAIVNGSPAGSWKLDRPGVFILEADLPDAPEYTVEIQASPTWTDPNDDRTFTVNLSMIRLIDSEPPR
jgi:ubiquinone/menaquinone biosynthesis C-methylase UbiE